MKTEEAIPEAEDEVESAYWLTPVKSDEIETAEQAIQNLIGRERIYAFGERTPGRKDLRPGDWIAFYASGNGVVAHAKVLTRPKRKPSSKIRKSDIYPWTFRVGDSKLYIDSPVVIDLDTK